MNQEKQQKTKEKSAQISGRHFDLFSWTANQKNNLFVLEFESFELMLEEFDKNVQEHWVKLNRTFATERKPDEEVDFTVLEMQIRMSSHLGTFVFSIRKKFFKDFQKEVIEFLSNNIQYPAPDWFHIVKQQLKPLTKRNVYRNIRTRKNDYGGGGLFYRLFQSPKIKYCSTKINLGSLYFNLEQGDKVHAEPFMKLNSEKFRIILHYLPSSVGSLIKEGKN